MHGACLREGRGRGRRARGAHHRRVAAAERQREVQGQELRRECRGLVGLPLQGADHRAEEPRSHHHLRDRRQQRQELGAGGVQLSVDTADRPVRRGAQDDRLSGCRGRPQHGEGEPRHPEERARTHAPALRRDRCGAEGSRHGRFDSAQLYRRQHRQLAHRQGRDDVLPGGGEGRAVFRGRPACRTGRFGAVRHGHRMFADRHLPVHPAQEGRPARHLARQA